MTQAATMNTPTDIKTLTLTSPLPLDRHPAAVYLAGLASGHSRRTMQTALHTIAAILSNHQLDALQLDWSAVRYQHTSAVRGVLIDQYKPATANKMLSALRGVLREAWQLGLMSAEDYHRAAAVKAVRGETLPAGRELLRGELEALLGACNADTKPAGLRDGALIACLYTGGLRRAEVVALTLSDYTPESGRLLVRGKGNKERTVYVPPSAAAYMDRWLALRGDDPGTIFCPINKGGKLKRGGLSAQAIYNMLKKRADQAGVKAFSPHDIRRTFVSDLLDAGADISTVSRLAGHANVSTTARYDRRPEAAKQKAAGLLHVPDPSDE